MNVKTRGAVPIYLPVSRAEMKSVFLNSTTAMVTAIAVVIGRMRRIFLDLDRITRCSQIMASGPTGGQQRSATVDTTGRVMTGSLYSDARLLQLRAFTSSSRH